MIRINLLRNAADVVSTQMVQTAAASDDVNKIFAAKAGVALVPLILLIGIEQYNLSAKEAEMKAEQAAIQRIQQEIKSMAGAVETVERYKKEKQRLEAQIEVIRELSQQRLKQVKSLDAIQSLTPSKVWYENLSISGKKVEIEGMALSDDYVSNLIQGLEESVFFQDVILTKSVEKRTDKGNFRSFELTCQLGSFQ